MDRTPMSYLDVAEALCARPGWFLVDGRIVRIADCGSQARAQAMVAAIAEAADALDHHPDVAQRGAELRIAIATHHPPGISALDFALATRVDALVGAGEAA